MLINRATLLSLYTGYSSAFQGAFDAAPSTYQRIAMVVPSTTAQEEYGWLGSLPRIREWIGARVVQNVETYGYTIKNKPWELTWGVDRDKIEDDNIGLYTPIFAEIGRATGAFPDELVYGLLKLAFTALCYDGQPLIHTDHPMLNAAGQVVSRSNSQGGSGTPWFLADTSRFVKPIVFQQRRAFDFVRMDAATDEVVFDRKEYRYGVDGRCNVGFGLWQLIYGSRQPLTLASYQAARETMMGLLGDYDRPLGIMPNLLVVPPSLDGTARQILNAEIIGSTTNIQRGTAELLTTPYLA